MPIIRNSVQFRKIFAFNVWLLLMSSLANNVTHIDNHFSKSFLIFLNITKVLKIYIKYQLKKNEIDAN